MTRRGVWNKITRRKPNGANNQLAHRIQPNRTKPARVRGNISTPNACTRRSDFSRLIPDSKCTGFSFGFPTTAPQSCAAPATSTRNITSDRCLGPGSEIGLIVCAADLRRFRLRFLGHNLSLVVDCPSNRFDGRLTFQKGFNRAFSLSAFMSSSCGQRPYPIPPLLPQLAECTLKVSQMLVLNHFHVLSR